MRLDVDRAPNEVADLTTGLVHVQQKDGAPSAWQSGGRRGGQHGYPLALSSPGADRAVTNVCRAALRAVTNPGDCARIAAAGSAGARGQPASPPPAPGAWTPARAARARVKGRRRRSRRDAQRP